MEKSITLTRQEIGEAIVNYIGTFKENKPFFPYRICSTKAVMTMPAMIIKNVTFNLEHIPKGTTGEQIHNI